MLLALTTPTLTPQAILLMRLQMLVRDTVESVKSNQMLETLMRTVKETQETLAGNMVNRLENPLEEVLKAKAALEQIPPISLQEPSVMVGLDQP